jgi:hypothetical protein
VIKNLKSVLFPVIAIATLGAAAILENPKPAQAYQSYEHEISDFAFTPNSASQAGGNTYCQNKVYTAINWNGGLFNDSSHGGRINFIKFSRPYVWANMGAGRCVINASWGYFHW